MHERLGLDSRFRGNDSIVWRGIAAPASTPRNVRDQCNRILEGGVAS